MEHDLTMHRRGNHDHISCALRERVPEHRRHLVHGPHFERAHHGGAGGHDMVSRHLRGQGPVTDIRRRHVYMVISEIATLLIYTISMVFLPEYFGKKEFHL